MRYDENQPTDVRLPRGYPVLAEISIHAEDWFEFERLFGDTPVTKIVWHDDSYEGRMLVHVACASLAIRDRLEDGWG